MIVIKVVVLAYLTIFQDIFETRSHLVPIVFPILVPRISRGIVFFEDKFDSLDAWVQSTAKGAKAGKFELTASKFYGDAKFDQGAQTSQDGRFYGMSAKFKPFSNTDKPMVSQFTVKHEQNMPPQPILNFFK